MKILSIVSTFPPFVYGGGEVSALSLTRWLAAKGHRMGVLTAAEDGQSELNGEVIDGLEVWRLRYRRQYTYSTHMKAPKWQKPLWYLQDHLDPDNRRKMSRVLDEFRPNCVMVHVIAGLGYNSLYEIGRRDIPTVYFMHDLNLVCAKGAFFSNGKECVGRCLACVAIGKLRFSAVSSIARLALCSPSKANLDAAAEYIPVKKFLNAVLLNANEYPEPTVIHSSSTKIRFLYVGRLHAAKGVHILLSALDSLAKSFEFSVNVVGSGPEEQVLRERFGDRGWCHFHGHLTEQQVSDFMEQSDVLCIPSVWQENSPGVVIHALSQGLPVIGSDKGGIPELVSNNRNGLLVPAGDTAAWRNALEAVLREPKTLEDWRANLAQETELFDQDQLGQKLLHFIVETAEMQAGNAIRKAYAR
ncbi:MAG: glycosyltransferase [Alphaproteobacteria bacterium]|nr:MAG: glycosyltransferase [Alphaproteobacteria bacterium]